MCVCARFFSVCLLLIRGKPKDNHHFRLGGGLPAQESALNEKGPFGWYLKGNQTKPAIGRPFHMLRSQTKQTTSHRRSSRDWQSKCSGCQNRYGIPVWGRCTTHCRTYFSGWIGMFTGGTICILTHGQAAPWRTAQCPHSSRRVECAAASWSHRLGSGGG